MINYYIKKIWRLPTQYYFGLTLNGTTHRYNRWFLYAQFISCKLAYTAFEVNSRHINILYENTVKVFVQNMGWPMTGYIMITVWSNIWYIFSKKITESYCPFLSYNHYYSNGQIARGTRHFSIIIYAISP